MWRNYIYEILEYTLQYHTMFIECLINHFSTIDDLEYIITVQIILIMELQLNKEIDDEILNLN